MSKHVMVGLLLTVLLAAGCARLGGDAGRAGVVTVKGAPLTLVGPALRVGRKAPDFTAMDGQFKRVSLSDFAGRPVLISSVPSLDTPVCSLQTKQFNDEVGKLADKAVMIAISMDLPFAQTRFCDSAKADTAVVLSDSALREFANAYGLLIKERGLLARAVIIIDRDGRIAYMEIVPELTEHPDYESALEALRKIVGA